MKSLLYFPFSASMGALFLLAFLSAITLDHQARGQATPNDQTATNAVQLVALTRPGK